MATATSQAPAGVQAGEHPVEASDDDSRAPQRDDCYLRMGFTTIQPRGSGFGLHCLACSWRDEAPVCAIAFELARTHGRQKPVGSAGHELPPTVSPAQEAAATNYVRRIPSAPQQGYAEEYLLWCLANRPAGCEPLVRSYGLSLTAGEHLRATIEAMLRLPPPAPAGRRRRR